MSMEISFVGGRRRGPMNSAINTYLEPISDFLRELPGKPIALFIGQFSRKGNYHLAGDHSIFALVMGLDAIPEVGSFAGLSPTRE
jgi:hypothetical protein